MITSIKVNREKSFFAETFGSLDQSLYDFRIAIFNKDRIKDFDSKLISLTSWVGWNLIFDEVKALESEW